MSVIFNMENLDVLRMEIYHNHQKPFCVVCLTVKITRQNNVIRIRELSPMLSSYLQKNNPQFVNISKFVITIFCINM